MAFILKSSKSIIVVLIALIIIMNPLFAGQENGDAAAEAKMRAKEDVSKPLWIAIGFLFPVLGNILAYTVPFKSPPEEALLGKDENYVQTYTRAYKSEIRKIQGQKALVGTLIFIGVSLVLGLILSLTLAEGLSSCGDGLCDGIEIDLCSGSGSGGSPGPEGFRILNLP